MIRSKITLLGGTLLFLLGIALFRATFVYKRPSETISCDHLPKHEKIVLDQAILNRFMGALDIPTISYDEHVYSANETLQLHEFIRENYPRIHNAPFIEREIIANFSLLYTVRGSEPTLRPYLLTSHMDVVPAIRALWSSDPFKASLKEDQHIYGRGTIDAKHDLMSMLEALEKMLERGFKPRRSFYLVFGHDEEVSGLEGAQTFAHLLFERLRQAPSRHEKLEFILDEGNVIISDRFPGLDSNLALVGVVEKGMMSVKLSSVGEMGHGSIPPPQTAISKLSKAVARFNSHVMPSFFGSGVEREMIEILAQHSSWPYKFVYSNFWLFKPILEHVFSSTPSLNSIIRTSTAVTMIKGGTKVNVLPDSAEAYINHRIHQFQTIDQILEIDKRIIDDPTIQLEIHGKAHNPSPVAPYDEQAYGFQLIKLSTQQVNPNTIIVPSVFLAASDSRWYTNLTDSIYKFSAITIPLQETKLFHGHDERISCKNYENLINFFHHLIQNSDSPSLQLEIQVRDDL